MAVGDQMNKPIVRAFIWSGPALIAAMLRRSG
jgi:hypothetical protein